VSISSWTTKRLVRYKSGVNSLEMVQELEHHRYASEYNSEGEESSEEETDDEGEESSEEGTYDEDDDEDDDETDDEAEDDESEEGEDDESEEDEGDEVEDSEEESNDSQESENHDRDGDAFNDEPDGDDHETYGEDEDGESEEGEDDESEEDEGDEVEDSEEESDDSQESENDDRDGDAFNDEPDGDDHETYGEDEDDESKEGEGVESKEGEGVESKEDEDSEEEDSEEESDESQESENHDRDGDAFNDELDETSALNDPDASITDPDVPERRKRTMILLLCSCCMLAIIFAVLLGVLFSGEDDDDGGNNEKPSSQISTVMPSAIPTLKPSAIPTSMPSVIPTASLSPTNLPTLHPPEMLFPVIADTYLRGGIYANENFGNDDTFLIINGDDESDTGYALLEFDLTSLPPDENIFRESEVILRLFRVQGVSNQTASISITKLAHSEDIDIETLTWEGFTPENGVTGPTFQVDEDTEELEIDITGLIRGTPSSRQLRGRRLQDGKTFLLLETVDDSNFLGEFFRSRESGPDRAPLIIHNFLTEAPSPFPSVSLQPTSEKPSGPIPTSMPSAVPSESLPPTNLPTLHPPEMLFPVIADTYLRGGIYANETFDKQDIFRIINGDDESDTGYALLEFDLTSLPPDENIFRESEVILRLFRVQGVSNQTASISITKLAHSEDIDIETLTWDSFTPEDGVAGPTFQVDEDTEELEIDITGLIRGTSSSPSSRQIRGRRLQNGKTFLLLETVDASNFLGESFHSTESGPDTAPLIIHNFLTEAPSPFPSVSLQPSPAPSLSAQPSLSSGPSTSLEPSLAPSTSIAPSTSHEPSLRFSTSRAPSDSPSESPSKSHSPSISMTPSSDPTTIEIIL
jgi:hypothetical protein